MRAIAIHRVPTLAKASSETIRVLCERVPNIATQKGGRLQGLHKYARQHPWPYMAHQGELSLRRMRRTRCIKTYLLDAEIDLVLAVDRSRGRKSKLSVSLRLPIRSCEPLVHFVEKGRSGGTGISSHSRLRCA